MPDRIVIGEHLLSANDQLAGRNRARLDAAGVTAINVMASPGAGKTSTILGTFSRLAGAIRLGVIEGDLASSIDTDKALAAGIPAVQINTGGGCHLEAHQIEAAIAALPLEQIDLLVIENVGNLVCPASWNLGTHYNIVIASVPEGADKPYKYPVMYRGIDALILNKTDLLPYIDFDMDYFRQGVEILNPGVAFFPLSCRTGEGFEPWLDWLKDHVRTRVV